MSSTFELKSIGVWVRVLSIALALGLLVSCVVPIQELIQDDESEHVWSSPPDGSFESVSVGWIHACGVRPDGSVVCWGYDGHGEASPAAGTFASVSAGTHHTCGVRRDGWISCWGYGGHGQSRPPTGTLPWSVRGDRIPVASGRTVRSTAGGQTGIGTMSSGDWLRRRPVLSPRSVQGMDTPAVCVRTVRWSAGVPMNMVNPVPPLDPSSR